MWPRKHSNLLRPSTSSGGDFLRLSATTNSSSPDLPGSVEMEKSEKKVEKKPRGAQQLWQSEAPEGASFTSLKSNS